MRLTAIILMALICSFASANNDAITPSNLRCEYRTNPLGIDLTNPRLSWILKSNTQGQKQTAYQVLVSDSKDRLKNDKGNLWDSGKVDSDKSIHIAYNGTPLPSSTYCYWKVRVWDKDKKPSGWSDTAYWSTGPKTWNAEWISGTNIPAHRAPHDGYMSHMEENQDTLKWVAIDLGSVKEINAVRLAPAHPYHKSKDLTDYLFPPRYKIEAAKKADFSDAVTVIDCTDKDQRKPGDNVVEHTFDKTRARYVRMTVTKLCRYNKRANGFALAELEVLSGKKNVAEGCISTASDLNEGKSGWSIKKLTDCRTKSDRGTTDWEQPSTMLRKSFSVKSKIHKATVYVSGLGLYEMYLNGRRVGDHILAPEYTHYGKRVFYQTFDVTKLLRTGENTIGAMLGDGWYSGWFLFAPHPLDRPFGARRGFIMRMDIEMDDGTTQTIVTDKSWRWTDDGPIRSAGIYTGEQYDALKEMPGWNMPGFDDSKWQQVIVQDKLKNANLVWQRNEPIRIKQELKPIAITEPEVGVHIFDMGQNMVGWCRLKVRGSAGSVITIRHGEMLTEDGDLYTKNLRRATQQATYIKRTDEEEIFEPHFTYFGFRYIEVTGGARPELEDLVGRVFHSDAPEAGDFQCSSRQINDIMHMVKWAQIGNMHGILSDCPQRNERAGWLGDLQTFSQTAIFNMDMAALFNKITVDIRDSQLDDGNYSSIAPMFPGRWQGGTPAWSDTGTILPWRIYQNYADTRLVEEHYDSARRWVDYVSGLTTNMLWETDLGNNHGDWLNGDTIDNVKGWPESGGMVPKHILASAFYAHSADLVSRMAEAIGKTNDAGKYRLLFENIKKAFNEQYVSDEGRIEGDTQAGYALALHFDLLPETLRPKAAKHMVDGLKKYNGHLSTGIITTHILMLELSRYGYNDEAYRLLNLRTFPSWGFMLEQGATTIWERWDGYVKGRGFQSPMMNSFNHVAFGAVGEWIWRNIVGINPDESQPGYKHFIIRPRPGGGVTWAKGTYRSIRGPITVDWRIEDETFVMDISVPPGTTATAHVPTKDGSDVSKVGPGNHTFSSEL